VPRGSSPRAGRARLAPSQRLIDWTHEEVEAGADVVVMHGAPLLHGVEIFGGKPIFYDLGRAMIG
jgi:poly-gamma-glutamate capsule biosynthesis protein CapA/YwtB (metallophosphatase superfamily)